MKTCVAFCALLLFGIQEAKCGFIAQLPYAGANFIVFSDQNGQNTSVLNFYGGSISTIALNSATGDIYLASTSGMWKESGGTFTHLNNYLAGYTTDSYGRHGVELAILPDGSIAGVFPSSNYIALFDQNGNFQSSLTAPGTIGAMAADPATGDLYLATSNGLFKESHGAFTHLNGPTVPAAYNPQLAALPNGDLALLPVYYSSSVEILDNNGNYKSSVTVPSGGALAAFGVDSFTGDFYFRNAAGLWIDSNGTISSPQSMPYYNGYQYDAKLLVYSDPPALSVATPEPTSLLTWSIGGIIVGGCARRSLLQRRFASISRLALARVGGYRCGKNT